MKGVIIDYITDRGFGFLMDQDGKKRFFHISSIREKGKFLEELESYFYTEIIDRPCKVVIFTPFTNEKGQPVANAIQLTEQIVNDKTATGYIEVIIVDVRNEVHSFGRIVQGIRKGESKPLFATAGGNGTFRLGYPEMSKELFIDFRRVDDIGFGSIDIRQLALTINNRQNITAKFVGQLKQKLTGMTVRIAAFNNDWIVRDLSALRV